MYTEKQRIEIEKFFKKYETNNLDIKCLTTTSEDVINVHFYFYGVEEEIEKATFYKIINEYQKENPQYIVTPCISDTKLNNEKVYFCMINTNIGDSAITLYNKIEKCTTYSNFPPNKYVVVGYYALWVALTNDKQYFNKYFRESIKWFNKSLECKQNIKTSAYALVTLVPNLDKTEPDRAELYTKACKFIDAEIKQKLLSLLEQFESNMDNPEEVEKLKLQELEYIANLIEEESGEKVGNFDWYTDLEKYK